MHTKTHTYTQITFKKYWKKCNRRKPCDSICIYHLMLSGWTMQDFRGSSQGKHTQVTWMSCGCKKGSRKSPKPASKRGFCVFKSKNIHQWFMNSMLQAQSSMNFPVMYTVLTFCNTRGTLTPESFLRSFSSRTVRGTPKIPLSSL